jgi:protein AbiQ
LKLYTIETDYIEHLKKFQSHIWDNEDNNRLRPYVGVVLNVGDHKYYAPLSSPKPKHEKMQDRLDFIRLEYKGKLIAALNLNNIIPVDDELVTLIDIDKIEDKRYKELLNVEMIDIRRKRAVILKNANSIYNKVTKFGDEPKNARLVSLCYDFILLEQKLHEYLTQNKQQNTMPVSDDGANQNQ